MTINRNPLGKGKGSQGIERELCGRPRAERGERCLGKGGEEEGRCGRELVGLGLHWGAMSGQR